MTKPQTQKKPAPAVDAKPGEYVVLKDGWAAGRRVKKDQRITLTAAAAKYETNVRPL